MGSSHPDWKEGHFERSGLLNSEYMATFYILYSATLSRYYVGHTTEPMEERLRKHLSSNKTWAAKARDWKVVWTEHLTDKSSAYRREREVKSWKSRTRIEALIGRTL